MIDNIGVVVGTEEPIVSDAPKPPCAPRSAQMGERGARSPEGGHPSI